MKGEISLSIVVTVVGGKETLRRCLAALRQQVDPAHIEVIVPYDEWSRDVGDLAPDFPHVHFHFIGAPGEASLEVVSARAHCLYDRRRAVGLALASGRLIAMTEDHAVPAADWCSQILAAHEQPYGAIGGVVDNGIDRPMNWALYYCDFGRYGSPLRARESAYASDVNLAYKRHALEAVRDVWRDAYHETKVHWALHSRGEVVFLDPRMVVHQQRPALRFGEAYRERVEWGRVFAHTRVAGRGVWYRLLLAAGVPVLPLLLLLRVLWHMSRQGRSSAQMATTLPLAMCLLTGWALGELLGYLVGPPFEAVVLASDRPPIG